MKGQRIIPGGWRRLERMGWIFFVLWLLYLLVLFGLFSPVEIFVAAALTPRGGHVRVVLRFLGVRREIPLQINLLDKPRFNVLRILPSGELQPLFRPGQKRKPPTPALEAARRAIARGELGFLWIAGTGDAAGTALLCGALAGVTESLGALLPKGEVWVRTEPRFGEEILRLEAMGIASLRMAEVIRKIIVARREKRNGASAGKHHAQHHR